MEIDKQNLPQHIAVIMDGNRRWAKAKGLPVAIGHKEGAKTFDKVSRYANKIGIKYFTVYAFSTENWKRTKEEVGALMRLFQGYIDDYAKRADLDNIKLQFIGDLSAFSPKMQEGFRKDEERTKDNTGMVLNIAVNYGGRAEITNAVRKISEKVKNGECNIEDINEEMISDELYTAGVPDPDLVIRTSGEMRTSNFLPWQLVYSEFLFVQKNWPDFSEQDLDEAIAEYQRRNRKFGGK